MENKKILLYILLSSYDPTQIHYSAESLQDEINHYDIEELQDFSVIIVYVDKTEEEHELLDITETTIKLNEKYI